MSSTMSDAEPARSLERWFVSSHAEVNGVRLHYVAGGQGEPLGESNFLIAAEALRNPRISELSTTSRFFNKCENLGVIFTVAYSGVQD